MTTEGSAASSVSVGARKVLPEDVLLVAVHGARVDLQPASLEKACPVSCKPARGGDAAFEVSDGGGDVTADSALSEAAARATVFARVVSLMNGRSGLRPEVLTFLCDLLNNGITPLLAKEGGEGPSLAKAVLGAGSCLFKGEVRPLLEVISSCELSPLSTLTVLEGSTLVLGRFDQVGTAAMAAAAASNAIEIADGVAALTCEATRASTAPFDAGKFDVRPHRGQIACAERLRLMLEGSKSANSNKGGDRVDPESISTIPQYHGPARDAIAAATRAIMTEFNGSDAGPLGVGAGCVQPRDGRQTELTVTFLNEAVRVLTSGGKERSLVLRGAAGGDTSRGEAGKAGDGDGSGAEGVLRELQAVLAEEMALSLAMLRQEEEKATKAAAGGSSISANGGANQPPSGPSGGADMAGMSAAQIAKIEAKRAAKAAKAAAKSAAKKEKKKAAGLGVGCAELRQLVAPSGGGGSLGAEEIAAKLDPFRTGEQAMGPFLCAMAERLSNGGAQRKPKIAKGARDFLPEQMRVREQAFTAIRNVFKRHGAVEIDTPVFELKETLTGKYGEDSKLIYDLADQGGELLALRYDLTVPFARYLALHGMGNIKRYHIAKVYRRDQPNVQLGRFREFYQCDFDIAGNYGLMVPDAEVLSVASEILSSLPIGNFQIKLNHRRLLDAILDICGCPPEKFRSICSAIDKLDKMAWAEVRQEMVEEKGLAPESADKIGGFVNGNAGGAKELWAKLTEEKIFGDHPDAAAAMSELELLFKYLDAMGTLKYVSFDLSLARGLAYYTGLIYECVVVDGGVKVGSIAAGGRYDNLVGMFSASGQTPCVGVSIGIERVLTIMEKRLQEERGDKAAPSNVQVYVASVGPGLLEERMRVGRLLWSNDISAEYSTADNPKFPKQMNEVLQRGIPFMVILGEKEVQQGVVQLKDMNKHTQEDMRREDVPQALLAAGCTLVTSQTAL
eukprot:g9291.t1